MFYHFDDEAYFSFQQNNQEIEYETITLFQFPTTIHDTATPFSFLSKDILSLYRRT